MRTEGKDTLILVDPTEIRKEYAYKMEYVTRVRDASRSSKEGRDVIVNGYHGCIAAACTSGSRKTIPLALKLWSSRAPGFKGENDEVLKAINGIFEATGGKGIVVYDRGGDRPAFYGDFIEKGRDFMWGDFEDCWEKGAHFRACLGVDGFIPAFARCCLYIAASLLVFTSPMTSHLALLYR